MPGRFFGYWCIPELKLQNEGGLQFEPWLKRGWLEPLGRPLDFFPQALLKGAQARAQAHYFSDAKWPSDFIAALKRT